MDSITNAPSPKAHPNLAEAFAAFAIPVVELTPLNLLQILDVSLLRCHYPSLPVTPLEEAFALYAAALSEVPTNCVGLY